MSLGSYIGISNTAKQIGKIYIGVPKNITSISSVWSNRTLSISGNTAATNKVVYAQAKVRNSSAGTGIVKTALRYQVEGGSSSSTYVGYLTPIDGTPDSSINDDQWHTVSNLINTYDSSGNNKHKTIIAISIYPSSPYVIEDPVDIKDVMVINLTSAFGSGNEPSKADCDSNIMVSDDGTITYQSATPKTLSNVIDGGLVKNLITNWTVGSEATLIQQSGYFTHVIPDNSVARLVKKGYIGINGIARLWYPSALEITYSGSYTDEIVTMDGSTYRLLTLTSSGTFAASTAVTADIWICGGGCGGYTSSYTYGSIGGAGAYATTANNQTFQNITVSIGAGGVHGTYVGTGTSPNGGATSITGDVVLTAQSGNYYNGGTGGGGAYGSTSGGAGDGIAKTPFGSSYFSHPYCDGGGGGFYKTSNRNYNGGNGGTNGGNGGNATSSYSIYGPTYGAGGGEYGGYGGGAYYTSGESASNATGYGSGGGGMSRDSSDYYAGGSGYQGVCFIRIPIEQ